MAGIVVSTREPVVMLFRTEEPAQQFYSDGYDKDGVYWYSGEGVNGDMRWTHANRAVRDHAIEGRDLFLFERVQRKDGIWRYSHHMRFLEHKIEERPGKDGDSRKAIVFGLVDAGSTGATSDEPRGADEQLNSLAALKRMANELTERPQSTVRTRLVAQRNRSSIVARYARVRAGGLCEACGCPAPFSTPTGEPFLEVHHLQRLADGGADGFDQVAAVCPNCHRRCHYSDDSVLINQQLTKSIRGKEKL